MSDKDPPPVTPAPLKPTDQADKTTEKMPREIGGPKGPEPTRYNDWERNGRCIDF